MSTVSESVGLMGTFGFFFFSPQKCKVNVAKDFLVVTEVKVGLHRQKVVMLSENILN